LSNLTEQAVTQQVVAVPRAQATPGYGGCATARARLTADWLPVVGNGDFQLGVQGLAPSGVFLLGVDSGNTTLSWLNGCLVWLGPNTSWTVLAGDAAGFRAVPWPVPANPALRGVRLFAQALVVEPGGPLYGIANLTNSVDLIVGN
jgi:hypothetical protein